MKGHRVFMVKTRTEPKFKLGQKLTVFLMGMKLRVIITKRTLVADCDSQDYGYKYSFRHDEKWGWSWDGICEITLDTYIRQAELEN
jgi:hypothetical protein